MSGRRIQARGGTCCRAPPLGPRAGTCGPRHPRRTISVVLTTRRPDFALICAGSLITPLLGELGNVIGWRFARLPVAKRWPRMVSVPGTLVATVSVVVLAPCFTFGAL